MADTTSHFEATVAAGGGADSNALLEIRPESLQARARGAFVGLEPELGLSLQQTSWRLYARAGSTLRQSPQFGFLAWSTADVGAGYVNNTVQLAASLAASQFAASQFADEQLWGLGPQFLVSKALSERWRLMANLLTQWRSSQETTQRFDAAALALRYSAASSWQWGARASWMSLASTATNFDPTWRRLRVGPYLQTDLWGRSLQVHASPFVGLRQLQANQATQLGAVGSVEARFKAGWGLLARIDWTQEFGREEAGRADRTEFWLAITWQGQSGTAPQGTSAPASAGGTDDEEPVVSGHRVQFRLRAQGAKSVVVMGSFNGWSKAVPLERDAQGIWQAWVTSTAGRIRYHFLVDGVDRKPPSSPRYVADGFGGVDGEIEVGQGEHLQPNVSPEQPASL